LAGAAVLGVLSGASFVSCGPILAREWMGKPGQLTVLRRL
jgi:hypothetical protein